MKNLILILCTLVIFGCSNTSKVEEDDSHLFASPTPTSINTYYLGDIVNLGDREITVYGFQPYNDESMESFNNTSEGITMEVLIENKSNTPFRFNPLNFTVQNSEGQALTYFDVIPEGKNPALRSEQIAPGQKIRGFITYADTENPAIIYYKSFEGQMAKIEVKK